MSEGSVEIKDLVKTYVDDRGRPTFTAVKNISLHIENGEFMVLVGPSGCGKSTTLRMVAGLEKITSGTISIGGRVVNELEPKDRGIAMVFQNYALYPHMTIFNNMAFGLQLAKKKKDFISETVGRTSKALGLDQMLERKNTLFRAVSASALLSVGLLCEVRLCSFSTNRCPTWTRRCAYRCARKSPGCTLSWVRQ
jgi:multiple sugar transport system ATP-binding protein